MKKESENSCVKITQYESKIESLNLKIEDMSNENKNINKIYSEFQEETIKEKQLLIDDHKNKVSKLNEKLVVFLHSKYKMFCLHLKH